MDVADIADRYTKTLRQRDLVDFDDLVALPVTLLDSDPDLAAAYRDRYRWVSVDECEDIDEQQYRLLNQLAGPRRDGRADQVGPAVPETLPRPTGRSARGGMDPQRTDLRTGQRYGADAGPGTSTGRSPFLADLNAAVCEQIGEILPSQKPRDTQLRLL